MQKSILIILIFGFICTVSLTAQNTFKIIPQRTHNVISLDNEGNTVRKVLVSKVPRSFDFSQRQVSNITNNEKPLTYSRYIYQRIDGSQFESTDLNKWYRTSNETETPSKEGDNIEKSGTIVTSGLARLDVASGSKYEVYSILGNKLEKDSFNGTAIDFSNYQNGMYIVLINNKAYKILKVN